jgi:hypothetical protein
MKVDARVIFASFYLRAVGDNSLSMAEIHPDPGEIWDGMGL